MHPMESERVLAPKGILGDVGRVTSFTQVQLDFLFIQKNDDQRGQDYCTDVTDLLVVSPFALVFSFFLVVLSLLVVVHRETVPLSAPAKYILMPFG